MLDTRLNQRRGNSGYQSLIGPTHDSPTLFELSALVLGRKLASSTNCEATLSALSTVPDHIRTGAFGQSGEKLTFSTFSFAKSHKDTAFALGFDFSDVDVDEWCASFPRYRWMIVRSLSSCRTATGSF